MAAMSSARAAGLWCAVAAIFATGLAGCGGGSSPSPDSGGGGGTTTQGPAATTTVDATTTSTTTTTTNGLKPGPDDKHCTAMASEGKCSECEDGYQVFGGACLFACESDTPEDTFNVSENDRKGLCLDDMTMTGCAEEVPFLWPNTNTPIKTLRLFASWPVVSSPDGQEAAWDSLVRTVKKSGIKVLVGTIVTCNHTDDERDWNNTLALIKRFGPEHIMGLAVGNEQELLWQKDYVKLYWPECITDMWAGGYYWATTESRVRDMDALGPEYRSIPVTSVVGAASFAGWPFEDDHNAMVKTYLENATKTYRSRWVFSMNLYPYFDPGNALDPGFGDKCQAAIKRDLCYDKATCVAVALVKDLRDRIKVITGNSNDTLWVGETGWSYPQAKTLDNPVNRCANFSSKDTFTKSYGGYLNWDLTLPESLNIKGPDHVFYFTMRDSNNFGLEEHFGLLGDCGNHSCKLQNVSYSPPVPALCADLGCGPYDPAQDCQCNPTCVDHGNCCPDYEAACPPGAAAEAAAAVNV